MGIGNIRDKLDGDELDLSMMSLKEVPLKDIASVPRATTLDLSSNLLKNLPPNFGAVLTHVVKLDLSANKLQALPKTFHQLVNLKHLDLYNNQLTELPESLHHLTKLRFLDIKNNPLKPELQAVVGDCLTRKECEAAAKKIVAHFTKEKQLAIEAEAMANKLRETREQQQREEAEAARQRNEKKAAKKERKNENKHQKQQQQQQHVQETQQHRHSSNHSSAKTADGAAAKTRKAPAKGGSWCSCLGWLNMLLLLSITTAAVWCLHLHTEGDYSEAGLRAAVPRLHKSLLTLQNVTAEALQPDNLYSSGRLVASSVAASAHQAGAAAQRALAAGQAAVEVYTGDLTPYTSQVTKYSSMAYRWTCLQMCSAYHWLLAQDWRGMGAVIVDYLSVAWGRLQECCQTLLQHPSVAAAWSSVCMYSNDAVTWLHHAMLDCTQYLHKNGPVWLEAVRDNTYNAISGLKESIQALLK